YGGAVVVGCIDEDKRQGMAVTRARKFAIAERCHDLLTRKYGLPARDLIFDALVFPVGTGDANYVGSAVETIEGIRAIKQRFPECKTILGISNVSFGLPPTGREVLNSVFLYHCTKAGLDYAIVNTERLERYPSIPEEERRLAEDLIYWRGADPVAAFAAYFREKRQAPPPAQTLSLDERLARYIVEGSRDGLIGDLNAKLREATPLEIVNGPLMRGMDEVGRLFNDNQLIVAEVLQSAEAMKAAVAHLEQFMEKAEVATRGTIVLATLKGDVHDIGKNLVEIIVSNNSYRVINLGIKVTPEELIAAPTREALVARIRREQAALAASAAGLPEAATPSTPASASRRLEGVDVPAPPDFEQHVLRDVPLGHIYPYLNLQMLYGKHLGIRGLVERLLEAGDPKALEVRAIASAWKERGEYVRSHALQALAIECAEAFAEMLHSRLRTLWGFPDPPELSIGEKLKAHYRGIRVSFGYPACPNLADQASLFRLLEPEALGLTLTDGFMMDPEASVSALVFHHPAAKYFKAD